MPGRFVPFGAQHGLTVLSGAVVLTALLIYARRGATPARRVRALLAFLCLAAFGYSQAAWLTVEGGADLDSALPLQLCDLAAIVAGFALLSGNRLLASLTYFWGLAGTVQALATPAITIGFPHPAYFSFFTHHFAIVGAALYLPLVDGWRPLRPWWRGPLHAWRWSLLYAVVAGTANFLLGTNFGFLARKPDNPSLLDQLGPWPWYLLPLNLLALALFSLLVLPFAGSRRAAEEDPRDGK